MILQQIQEPIPKAWRWMEPGLAAPEKLFRQPAVPQARRFGRQLAALALLGKLPLHPAAAPEELRFGRHYSALAQQEWMFAQLVAPLEPPSAQAPLSGH